MSTSSAAQNETTDQLLTPQQAAQLLQIQPNTLAKWRSSRSFGPEFVRVGSAIRYRRDRLQSWIARNTYTTTMEADAAA